MARRRHSRRRHEPVHGGVAERDDGVLERERVGAVHAAAEERGGLPVAWAVDVTDDEVINAEPNGRG